MVCLHNDAVAGALKVSTPILQAVDDYKHFLVADFVVCFRRYEHTGVEGDRVEVAIVRLGNNSAKGKVGCIGLQRDWECWVKVLQERGKGKSLLQGIEGSADGGREVKLLLVFAEQGCYTYSQLGITSDKMAVVVGKAQEDLGDLNRP
jgi:hypothetical protein